MSQPPSRPRSPIDQLFDLLEEAGLGATLDGKPISREELKTEVGRRVETRVRGFLHRLIDERIPPGKS